MKKQFSKILVLIPLILLAGVSFATYAFIGPTAAPTGNNTDAPLNISATDQIKNGGLSVATFQSRTGSDFAQQTQLTGLVNGGTAASTSSTIPVGTAADKTSVSNTGSTIIAGNYQSDSLKTGGGLKPLCADNKGTFYICGATPPVNVNPIYLSATLQTFGFGDAGTEATAHLSEATNAPVTVTLAASSANSNALAFLKNMFTADARFSGVCYYTATPTVIGTITIYGGTTDSWDSIPLPAGCNSANTYISISSYSPTTTMGGRKIIVR